MRNHDVEELFTLVAVGDTAEMIGTPGEEIGNIFRDHAGKPANPAVTMADGGAE